MVPSHEEAALFAAIYPTICMSHPGMCRAGFTLNRALFRRKCGGPRAPNTIIGLLLAPTVPSITQNFYLIYYFDDFRAISVSWHVAEFFCSCCGCPIFVGAPVQPNMLNMPKSASGHVTQKVTKINVTDLIKL